MDAVQLVLAIGLFGFTVVATAIGALVVLATPTPRRARRQRRAARAVSSVRTHRDGISPKPSTD